MEPIVEDEYLSEEEPAAMEVHRAVMDIDEMLAEGYNVAPDYEEMKKKTELIFKDIPEREKGSNKIKEDRISYLWNKHSQTSAEEILKHYSQTSVIK